MNISDLKTIINHSIEDNILLLKASDLESTSIIQTLTDFFPDNMLKLEFMDGKIAFEDLKDKEGILLRGMGTDFPFLGSNIELSFYMKEENLQFELTAVFNNEFTLAAAFLPFKGTLLENVCFSKSKSPIIHVTSVEPNEGQDSMFFEGTIDLQATDSKLADFLGKKEISVSGPICLKENGSGIYNFEFVASEISSIDLGIAKPEVGFKLSTNMTYNRMEENYPIIPYIELYTDLSFEANSAIKSKIPLSARIFGFNSDIRFRGDLDSNLDVFASDLMYLANGVNLFELMPSKDFYIDDSLKLDELFWDYDLKSNKLSWINISVHGTGSWSIILEDSKKGLVASNISMELCIEDPFDVQKIQVLTKGEVAISDSAVMVVETTTQGQGIKAYIKEGSNISLKEVAATFLGEDIEIPEMKIEEFNFYLGDGKYIAQGNCYDYWPLNIGETQQNLSDVCFSITKNAENRSQLQISGFLPTGNKDIYMHAISTDAGKGWVFEGSTLKDESISFDETVIKLFQPVGVFLADGLPEFFIQNLSLCFEEKGHSCFLEGECIGTWKIPVGNRSVTVDQMSVALKYENGKISGAITGKTEFAGSQIDITYDLTKTLLVDGILSDLDTGLFIDQACGDQVLENLPMPLGIESIKFNQASILFDINNGLLKLEGNGYGYGFTKTNLIIKKVSNGFEIEFMAGVGEGWKFTSISPCLSELDNMSFQNTSMIISNSQVDQFMYNGINGVIVPGINFLTQIKLDSTKETSFIKKLLKLEEEYLPVHCAISDLGQAEIQGNLSPLLMLGNSLELQNGILKLNVDETGISCSILGNLKMALYESLTFAGVLSVTEKSVNYCGRIKEDWNNPFNIQDVIIKNLSINLDMDEMQIPKIDLYGDVQIGDANGEIMLIYNVDTPSQSVLEYKFDTLDIGDIISICTPSILSSTHPQWSTVINTNLNNAELFVVPETTKIGQIEYEKGMWGKGILEVNGFRTPVNIEVIQDQEISIHTEEWKYDLNNETIQFFGNIGEACKNVFGASLDGTITAYKAAGRTANDAAISIKTLYGVEVEDAALALKRGGFDSVQIAIALTGAYKVLGEKVTKILKSVGYIAGDTALALKMAYDTTSQTAAMWLKSAGYTARQCIEGLITAYEVNIDNGAILLKYAGYTSGQVASNIKSAYSASVESIAIVLKGADYNAMIVASFIRTAFGVKAQIIGSSLRNAGYTGEESTGAIKYVYGWTAKATTKLLKSVGYTAEQLSAGLKSFYRLDSKDAAYVLRSVDYTAGQVLFGLKNVYHETVEASAGILRVVGYSADETAEGFKTSFDAIAVVTAVILKKVEYTVKEVAGAIKNVYILSLEDTTKVLRNAGYDAVQATEGLKDAYGVSENEMAMSLREAGFTSSEVAQGLKSIYGSEAGTTASALRFAGYTGEQTAEALKNIYEVEVHAAAILLKGAGYISIESAWGLKSAYAIAVDMTAAALKGVGFTSEEVACGIKAAYEISLNDGAVVLKGIGFDGKETSLGLSSAYKALADETAKALWVCGYSAVETANGLKFVYKETDKNTAATLKMTGYTVEEIALGLKTVYEASKEGVASCLKEAGFTSDQTSLGLKTVYLFESDILVRVLKEVGYSAVQITSALKSTYSETAEKISTLLKGIGYNAGQIAYSLRLIFNESLSGASILLKGAGFTAEQTAEGLKSSYGGRTNTVASKLKSSGYPAEEVAYYIKSVYGETAVDMAIALKDAGYTCEENATGLKVAYSQWPGPAASVLNLAGYTAIQIITALKESFEATNEIAASAMRTAGFDANTTLQAVNEVYVISSQEASTMLNKAEYFALQIAEAIKNVYAVTSEELVATFKQSGQTVDEIASSLKEVYALTAADAILVIKTSGYSVDEAGRAMTLAYKLGPNEIAVALAEIGYTVLDVGSYLRNVGRYSGEVTNTSLLAAKYNVDEVKEFMKASFGWYTPIEIPDINIW